MSRAHPLLVLVALLLAALFAVVISILVLPLSVIRAVREQLRR